jgi:hypothetical protein
MIGSTFIYEADQERLVELQSSVECLDDMTIVELDSLITLDFEVACTRRVARIVPGLNVRTRKQLLLRP